MPEIDVEYDFFGIVFIRRYNKEEIDGTIGLLHVNLAREKYFQLQFCWDDLVYDRKNHEGGKTIRQPFGIKWLSRLGGDKWNFFTSGNYSAGFERDFPDEKKSPDRSHYQQQINQAVGKVTYHITQKSRMEANISHYHFLRLPRPCRRRGPALQPARFVPAGVDLQPG